MNAALVAQAVRANTANSPQGKTGFVSNPTSVFGPFESIISGAKNVGSLAGKTVLDIFAPNEFSVPGAAPIANSIAKGAQKVGNEAANSINAITKSATTGVETGFKNATFIIVIIVGVWLWSVIKPR